MTKTWQYSYEKGEIQKKSTKLKFIKKGQNKIASNSSNANIHYNIFVLFQKA